MCVCVCVRAHACVCVCVCCLRTNFVGMIQFSVAAMVKSRSKKTVVLVCSNLLVQHKYLYNRHGVLTHQFLVSHCVQCIGRVVYSQCSAACG